MKKKSDLPDRRTLKACYTKKTPFRSDTLEKVGNFFLRYFPGADAKWLTLPVAEFERKLRSVHADGDETDFLGKFYRDGELKQITKTEQLNALAQYKGYYHLARSHRVEDKIAFELLEITDSFDEGIICYLVTRKGNVHRGRVVFSKPNLFFTFVRPRLGHEPGMRSIYIDGPGQTRPTFIDGCVLRTANTGDRVVSMKCTLKRLNGQIIPRETIKQLEELPYSSDCEDFVEKDSLPLFGQINADHHLYKDFSGKLNAGVIEADDANDAIRYWRQQNWADPAADAQVNLNQLIKLRHAALENQNNVANAN